MELDMELGSDSNFAIENVELMAAKAVKPFDGTVCPTPT